MSNLHQVQVHAEFVEGCFGCKASTLQLSTGEGNNSFAAKMDKSLEKDRPAYKSMKEAGLQPARLTGAHELMTKAETSYEIESGNLMPGKAKEIETFVKEFKDATGKKATESTAVVAQ
jgi:hypothetical protein